jgi:hypothetical protein
MRLRPMQSRKVIMNEHTLVRNSISCGFTLKHAKVKESKSFS